MKYYYINLSRAPERRERMEMLLKDKQHERVEAIDGKLWDGTGWKKQGRAKEHYWRGSAGCWFSHIRALERAVATDVFPCCILEDDAEFVSEPIMPADGPGMVYFGGLDTGPFVYGAHAIAYRTKADAQSFLCWLRAHKTTVDGAAVMYQKRTSAIQYCRPWSIIQRLDYSYIQERTYQPK